MYLRRSRSGPMIGCRSSQTGSKVEGIEGTGIEGTDGVITIHFRPGKRGFVHYNLIQ